ncbi:MAG: O-antigen ligase family protein [Candidatus Moranbacteria bacterium]|nr:O-antigen ligase family protein [Candidatus Moranbacteria bacterium]
MRNYFNKIELSKDQLMTIFIVAFVGFFLIANYFFGFNLPLYVITLTIGAVLAMKYPHAGLYAIVFLTFIFERFFTLVPIVMGRSEYKIYPIDVLFGAMLIGIMFQLASGTLKLKSRKLDYLLIVFAALAAIYFFVSAFVLKSDVALAFSTAKNYAFYSIFYFATFILIDSKERFRELLAIVFAGAIGILWFVFYGIVVRHGLWSDFTPLSTDGIRTLAFTHGYYLCMALIAGLVYVAYQSNLFSKWLVIVMPFWVLGIIGSMMRHLWISIFAAIVFLIVMFSQTQLVRLRSHAKNYIAIALMFLMVIFYGATLFPRSAAYETLSSSLGMVGSRVTSIANTSGDESIVWRAAVWQQAVKLYIHQPIFGIGLGEKVSVEIGKYRDFVEVRNIHNSFLVILVQMGILGLGLVLALTAMLGWKVLKAKFDDQTLQMGAYITLGILVLHLSSFLFQPYLEANLLGIFFWINLGVLRRISETNN